MIRVRTALFAAFLGLLGAAPLAASDPPHDASKTLTCLSCHKAHVAPGGTLTAVAGNANLCLSCHVSGGLATAKAFVPGDQALPPLGLPAGTSAAGTSHRWDSGPAGRVAKGTPNSSTGGIAVSGAYTGLYPTTIQIKISTAGQAGTAKFDWQMTTNGSSTWGTATTAVATSGTATALGSTGISVAFANGSANPSFVLNDIFLIYARPELRSPVTTDMSSRLQNGQIMCSTCHDQHSQADAAFDPASRSLAAGSAGRHFQRINNDTGQMCVDCHAPRNVTAKGGTSHPIGSLVINPAPADFKTPATALLDASSRVQCQSCHKVHYAPVSSGNLLRAETTSTTAGTSPLCNDCHTYATVTTNKGVHFDTTKGVLWPGAWTAGTYGTPGTTYPAMNYSTDAAKRATCINCHDPHGWPDAKNAAAKNPKLLVDNPSNLCLTCHHGTGTTPYQLTSTGTAQAGIPDLNTEITKTTHHPVERAAGWVGGRTVACGDCHNPHKAVAGSHTYSTTATSTRNLILNGATVQSGPLMGVDGVSATYGTAAWTAPTYAATPTATKEYQVCFKCHTSTSSSFGATPPAGMTAIYSTGTAKFTNGTTSVTGTGTTWNAGMVGAWIHKNNKSQAYRITAASATSLTLATPYAQATDASAAAYIITQETDVGVEFSPANRSGHPVVVGLNSYTYTLNTGTRSLAATYLKAPWASNPGTQTMMCSDCHNTDGSAAQGPHGSAAQFMLKGSNPGNWPNVTLTNFATSWCANCHNTFSNDPHGGNHSSYACWNCHVVVPHGSKRSRLIGDRTNMPARYAYNNLLTNMQIQQFIKASSATSYQKSYCQAACAGDHSAAAQGGTVETW